MLPTLLVAYLLGGLTFPPLILIFFWYTAPRDTPVELVAGIDDNQDDSNPDPHSAPPRPSGDSKPYKASVRRSFIPLPSTTSPDDKYAQPVYLSLKSRSLFVYSDLACNDLIDVLDLSDDKWLVDLYPVEDENDSERGPAMEGELFARRNAIRLRQVDPAPSAPVDMNKDANTSPPYFIFPTSLPNMESLYHLLIHAIHPSLVQSIDHIFSQNDMSAFLTRLDSTPDPLPTRWFNALLARLFFSFYKSSALESALMARLERKLSRLKKPTWLRTIGVKRIDVGTTPPVFGRPMLKNLGREGEATVEIYCEWQGEFRITLSGEAVFSWSGFGFQGFQFPSFRKSSNSLTSPPSSGASDSNPQSAGPGKTYVVPLTLHLILKSLSGNMVVQIRPPPSNRAWWGFRGEPAFAVEVIPVISERRLGRIGSGVGSAGILGWVGAWMQSKIKEVIQESVVLPNMDDIPFFSTMPPWKGRRGGMWGDTWRGWEMASPEDLFNSEKGPQTVPGAFEETKVLVTSSDGESETTKGPSNLTSTSIAAAPAQTADTPAPVKRRSWFARPVTPTSTSLLTSSAPQSVSLIDSTSGTSSRSKSLGGTADELGFLVQPHSVDGEKESDANANLSASAPTSSDFAFPEIKVEESRDVPPKAMELIDGESEAESTGRGRTWSVGSASSNQSSRSQASSYSGQSTSASGAVTDAETEDEDEASRLKELQANTKLNSSSGSGFLSTMKGLNIKGMKMADINREALSAQALGVVKKWGWKGAAPSSGSVASTGGAGHDGGMGGSKSEEDIPDGETSLWRDRRKEGGISREGLNSWREKVRERTNSTPTPTGPSESGLTGRWKGDGDGDVLKMDTSPSRISSSGSKRGSSPDGIHVLPSATSSVPIQRSQPSVAQMPRMTIPGIHAAHKGEVMSLSSDSATGSSTQPPPLPPRRSARPLTEAQPASSPVKSLETEKSPGETSVTTT